jgi:Family of unknown function (DUF6011)
MTRETAAGLLTDDDRMWLGRWTVGKQRQPGMEWLAGQPPADKVRAMLIKFMDRHGPETVFARVMADHLGADRHRLYAENWPRKAATLAADLRARGEHPHADRLHEALIALMYCAKCGKALVDPVSIERGIGPDCWTQISPAWRAAITGRLEAAASQSAGRLAERGRMALAGPQGTLFDDPGGTR